MRTYDQLNEKQQGMARSIFVDRIVSGLLDGSLSRDDDDFMMRVEAAVLEAEQMRTPWFAGQYIYDACREVIDSDAEFFARQAMYKEAGDPALIEGVAD